ncbi:MAG: signal peptidase I, partial [Actinomycetales bacterium]
MTYTSREPENVPPIGPPEPNEQARPHEQTTADGRPAGGHDAAVGHGAVRGHDTVPEAKPESRHRGAGAGAIGLLRETALVVGIALVLSLLIKTFLVQAFYIPSGSMENTLLRGDKVIVSKLTPGPFDLKRGDIVVFKDPGGWLDPTVQQQRGKVSGAVHDALTFIGLLPNDADDHLIKRVIGLPGDHVVCCDTKGKITVNGVPITEPYLYPGNSPSDKDFSITVPAGKIWVMGDHREISRDSRFNDPGGTGKDGSVPIDLVVGRAVLIVWPLDRAGWLGVPNTTF